MPPLFLLVQRKAERGSRSAVMVASQRNTDSPMPDGHTVAGAAISLTNATDTSGL